MFLNAGKAGPKSFFLPKMFPKQFPFHCLREVFVVLWERYTVVSMIFDKLVEIRVR